jgi:hypothetical protein
MGNRSRIKTTLTWKLYWFLKLCWLLSITIQPFITKKTGYQGLIYREAVNNPPFQAVWKIHFGWDLADAEKIIQHLIAVNGAKIWWDIDKTF